MSDVVEIPSLCLISDAEGLGVRTFLRILGECVVAGLPAVQIREPGWSQPRVRKLLAEVLRLCRSTAAGSCRVLINRRPELVEELGLDGCHVGGGDPRAVGAVRSQVGSGRLVGYSAHRLGELEIAAEEGADYVTYSPVFPTISKVHPLPTLGLQGLESACRASRIPVVALGGILPLHAADLRRAGAAGAAMIGGILRAARPARAVAEFIAAWSGTPGP